ncbi:MAG TPA: class I SAM-dependent methyltransferase [Steroidobacteraceae bacterium]|nr:class I SAM-dependent methyltransferase [Steroidobacteraceae bacterium]
MSETAMKATYQGPPDYRVVGRHGVFPHTTHDEIERFNFLAQMNRHLAARVLPSVKAAFDKRVAPQVSAAGGRFETRHDVRKALLRDPYYQTWSALRRMTMEQRQQAGRWVAVRQAEELAAKVDRVVAEDPGFVPDPDVKVPRYVSAVDHHCMPGSYHTEMFPGDVSAAANYDSGIFATTGGTLGRYSDGGGRAVLRWVERNLPAFRPKAILDIGSTLGHSLLPIAAAYPDAEVTAVDVSKPVLRYALARARSMGIRNLRFVQADGADLSRLPDASFDWVLTTMFLHELSYTSMKAVMRESFRLLKPGGLVLHLEQPQYGPDMSLFEQAMRDWDAFYNNEPFWSAMHEIDLDGFLIQAGFKRSDLIHGAATAVVDRAVFPDAADDSGEDYGRKAAWHLIGARKPA